MTAGRRWMVRGIFAIATVLTVAAIFAVWANRQVLDADNWAETSTELLEDEAVREQVSGFLVDQLYAEVDVAGEVEALLPPRLDPLAGPAANGLRQLAENRAQRLLGRPRVQELWEAANRVTAEQFIAIAEGESRAVTLNGNAVVLDLRPLVIDLVEGLGGSTNLVGRIPEGSARLKVMESDQVGLLQDSVATVQGLSAVLPGVAFALFALGVWLSHGRRRRALMTAGLCWLGAGLAVLIGRRAAGDAVVDALTSTEAVRPAAEAVWTIGTGILQDVAQATVIMGLPVVFAAWLAGPAKLAVRARRLAAPYLRDEPAAAYGVLAALILLVVAWGPIQATRMVLPVLLMTVLAVSGLAVLRRQVALEFPAAAVPDQEPPPPREDVAEAARERREEVIR